MAANFAPKTTWEYTRKHLAPSPDQNKPYKNSHSAHHYGVSFCQRYLCQKRKEILILEKILKRNISHQSWQPTDERPERSTELTEQAISCDGARLQALRSMVIPGGPQYFPNARRQASPTRRETVL